MCFNSAIIQIICRFVKNGEVGGQSQITLESGDIESILLSTCPWKS